MKDFVLSLRRFDGDGTATGATAGAAAQQSAESNKTSAGAAEGAIPSMRRNNAATPDKGKLFAELVNGEYKDEAAAWFQERFDKRHKDHKALVEQRDAMKPAMQLLQQAFGWDGKDPQALAKALEEDNGLWEKKALENDMTVDQYKKWVKMQNENQRLTEAMKQRNADEKAAETRQRLETQMDAVVLKYPAAAKMLAEDFKNESFTRMIQAGVDMTSAFEALHMEEIMSGAMNRAAQEAARQVADSVASNRRRPVENGTAGTGPASGKMDVANMTREERRELAKRASQGERIVL